MPAVRSVTLGIWAGVGSRDETPRLAGASHYLEHLLFKGTGRRSARDIAEAMDAVGGETNAFTSKEYTCFYARTLDRDLPLAVDVLVDMLRFSKMASADVDAERTVILEEIGMHNDAPDDVVHDLFAETLFGGHQLGRPVLGTVDSITAMRRDAIARYWRRHYVPGNLVVAAAGSLEHDQVVELVAEAFGEAGSGEAIGPREGRREPRVNGGVAVRRKPTEQAHVVLGSRGLSRADPRRFALGVLNVAFGGGVSSRLFQEVREKRGLVYSIYSYAAQYTETGSFSVLRRGRAQAHPRRAGHRPRRAGAGGGRRPHRGRAGAGQGPPGGVAGARHGGHLRPHDPPRQVRADLRRDPLGRRGHPPRRRRHRRRRPRRGQGGPRHRPPRPGPDRTVRRRRVRQYVS